MLYEMLTGCCPFAGETLTDSLGAITHKEPDWSRLPPIPARIRELLADCLAKDRSRRLQDIGDARLTIDRARNDGLPLGTARTGGRRSEISGWVLGVVGVAVAIGVFLARGTVQPGPSLLSAPVYAEVIPELTSRFITWGDLAGPVAASPDGTMLAFTAQIKGQPQKLWLRRLPPPAVSR